jgi:hypothetical protein
MKRAPSKEDGRLRALARTTWPFVPFAWALLGGFTLDALVDASFGPAPWLGEAKRLVLGQAWLLAFGLVGFWLSATTTFQLLVKSRPLHALLGVLFLCVPPQILSCCQLWAWAMFVGWV